MWLRAHAANAYAMRIQSVCSVPVHTITQDELTENKNSTLKNSIRSRFDFVCCMLHVFGVTKPNRLCVNSAVAVVVVNIWMDAQSIHNLFG